MAAATTAPFQDQIYLGKTVPNRTKDRIRFERRSPRETTLVMVLNGRVCLIPKTPSNVSKYLSPSNGTIGSILIRATLGRIITSQ